MISKAFRDPTIDDEASLKKFKEILKLVAPACQATSKFQNRFIDLYMGNKSSTLFPPLSLSYSSEILALQMEMAENESKQQKYALKFLGEFMVYNFDSMKRGRYNMEELESLDIIGDCVNFNFSNYKMENVHLDYNAPKNFVWLNVLGIYFRKEKYLYKESYGKNPFLYAEFINGLLTKDLTFIDKMRKLKKTGDIYVKPFKLLLQVFKGVTNISTKECRKFLEMLEIEESVSIKASDVAGEGGLGEDVAGDDDLEGDESGDDGEEINFGDEEEEKEDGSGTKKAGFDLGMNLSEAKNRRESMMISVAQKQKQSQIRVDNLRKELAAEGVDPNKNYVKKLLFALSTWDINEILFLLESRDSGKDFFRFFTSLRLWSLQNSKARGKYSNNMIKVVARSRKQSFDKVKAEVQKNLLHFLHYCPRFLLKCFNQMNSRDFNFDDKNFYD